jgi:hypothetical protein
MTRRTNTLLAFPENMNLQTAFVSRRVFVETMYDSSLLASAYKHQGGSNYAIIEQTDRSQDLSS